MHLIGFIIKKFVTMHGHMNVKIEIVMLRRIPMTILWNTAHFILKIDEADSSAKLVPID